MKYLHAMLRVRDLDATATFFTEGLGLHQTRRIDNEAGKFSLVYFAAPANPEAAPWKNTDRKTSGRSSNSAVGPWKRISPFSMK